MEILRPDFHASFLDQQSKPNVEALNWARWVALLYPKHHLYSDAGDLLTWWDRAAKAEGLSFRVEAVGVAQRTVYRTPPLANANGVVWQYYFTIREDGRPKLLLAWKVSRVSEIIGTPWGRAAERLKESNR